MSQANKFGCKRDSKGKFVKRKTFERKQKVLEGIKRRTVKFRAQHQQALQTDNDDGRTKDAHSEAGNQYNFGPVPVTPPQHQRGPCWLFSLLRLGNLACPG